MYSFLRNKKQKSTRNRTFFAHHRIVVAVKRVEIVSDRMPYMVLIGCWSHVILLNVHAPSEEKSDV